MSGRRSSRAGLGAVLVGVVALSGCNVLGRVSIPHPGSYASPTSAPSEDASPSADGRYVAFRTDASDVLPADGNGESDVALRDVATGATALVSRTPGGQPGAGASSEPALAADGSVVAFTSAAADLVADDANGSSDVFTWDRSSGLVRRVSVATGGVEAGGASSAPTVSADGRFVAFTSTAPDLVVGDTNGVADVFVHDRTVGTTTRVSTTSGGVQVAGASTEPSISATGDWIAFTSTATTLVSGDGNGVADVFVARRTGGTVRRVSAPDAVTRPFQQANAASGRPSVVDPIAGYVGSGEPLVAYESRASNLAGTDANGSSADVFVTTHLFGSVARTLRVSGSAAVGTEPSLAPLDGGPAFVVAFVRSSDGASGDVVVSEWDTPIDSAAAAEQVASARLTGEAANGPSRRPAVTADGRLVAFDSTAGDLAGRTLGPSASDVYMGRARVLSVESVEPPRVGLLETREVTVRGRGFTAGTTAVAEAGISVVSVAIASTRELTVTLTATATTPGDAWRDLSIVSPGVGITGTIGTTCAGCIEIAAVVEQPGPVDIEITGGSLAIGDLVLPVPGCVVGVCPSLPATVTPDGALGFGAADVELDPIDIPVELIPGVETTIQVVPAFVAPAGQVVPVDGRMELGFGLALRLRHALLPSACALGPVQASVSAGPGGDPAGVAYEQATGTATLAGGFSEELALTGCGFFTSALNAAIGLPLPIADNALSLAVRLDPVLTGTAVP